MNSDLNELSVYVTAKKGLMWELEMREWKIKEIQSSGGRLLQSSTSASRQSKLLLLDHRSQLQSLLPTTQPGVQHYIDVGKEWGCHELDHLDWFTPHWATAAAPRKLAAYMLWNTPKPALLITNKNIATTLN